MDIQHFLAVNIMVMSGLFLLYALLLGGPRLNLAWAAVNGLILVGGAALLAWAPGTAGTLLILVFVPFVLGPLVLGGRLRKSIGQHRLGEAAMIARVVSWLHPTSDSRFNAAIFAAQAAATPTERKAALERLAERSNPDRRTSIQAILLRMESRWEDLLALFDSQPALAQTMAGLKIRALGETGRLDQMTRAYEDAKPRLFGVDIWEAQLMMLSFTGRPQEVRRLLDGVLAAHEPESKIYWCAIADRASGAERSAWEPALVKLATTATHALTRDAAQRALAASNTSAGSLARLDDVSTVIVEQCAQRLRRSPTVNDARSRYTPVTWLLLAAIGGVYALSEFRGGATNMRTLVDLGALWPPYVLRRGEWWRLGTALFLHWGLLHVAANSFMLWVLGRTSERAYGSLSMAAIYVVGGLASSAFVLWQAAYGYSEPAVLVGASGAVMALFGALAGRGIVVWMQYRDALDARGLAALGLAAALQVAVDLATPQVSLSAHASGFIAGAAIGALLTLLQRRHTAPA